MPTNGSGGFHPLLPDDKLGVDEVGNLACPLHELYVVPSLGPSFPVKSKTQVLVQVNVCFVALENSEALADDHRTGRNEPQLYDASVLLRPVKTVSDLHAPCPCSVSPGSDVTLYVE